MLHYLIIKLDLKRRLRFAPMFILLFSGTILLSQNETKKWYFGNMAGLDFTSSPPGILTNGAMNTSEGCAGISDASGNILFYTDGITVYNQAHLMMANGNALFGNGSTTQSAIIVKQPANSNIYFVFTQDDQAGIDGLRYSVVDMSLAAGMGSVTIKNTLLYTPSCEKITAVKHCNGIDVWVISHDYNSDNFRAYLVNSLGVAAVPVLSAIGPSINSLGGALGQMKISPNGKTLGIALYDNLVPSFQLYDFDSSTGIISNFLALGNFTNAYGCEFSPDGTKFYGGRYANQLMQWDLCAGSPTAIVASQYSIASVGPGNLGSFQLAVNGKIYITRTGQQTLSVINDPNNAGASCNYVDLGQSIAPKTSALGLPNFINSFFKPAPVPFTFSLNCQTASFTAPATGGTINLGCTAANYSATVLSWSFGDPGSGALNTSTLSNPTHIYNGTGSYTAQLVLTYQCSSDTIKLPVTILNPAPTLTVSGNFSLCVGEKKTFTASGANTYTWTAPTGTGALTPSIAVSPTVTSTYTVTGANTSNTCSAKKTITVTVSKCTGIESITEEAGLKIYPNPVNSQLNVDAKTKTEIRILNQVGELVISQTLEAGLQTIDLSALSTGIYILRVINVNGTKNLHLIKSE